MHGQYKFIRCGIPAALFALLLPLGVTAGSLDSPGAPTDAAAQMHTLDDIYNRIDTGATATKATTFAEPSAGPSAGTQHTLDDIHTLAGERTRVMKTDATTCYDTSGSGGFTIDCAGTGQDGEKQAGMAEPSNRFIDNGDGTVTDTLTQLTWLQDAGCTTVTGSYDEGNAAIASLQDGQCGLSDGSKAGDWRMPNIRELLSIAYFGNSSYALFDKFLPDAPFVRSTALPLQMQSSTVGVGGGSAYVLWDLALVKRNDMTLDYYHLAVRGGLQ